MTSASERASLRNRAMRLPVAPDALDAVESAECRSRRRWRRRNRYGPASLAGRFGMGVVGLPSGLLWIYGGVGAFSRNFYSDVRP